MIKKLRELENRLSEWIDEKENNKNNMQKYADRAIKLLEYDIRKMKLLIELNDK